MRIKNPWFYVIVSLMLVLFGTVSCGAPSSQYAGSVNGVKIKNQTVDMAVNTFVESQRRIGIPLKEEDKEKVQKSVLEELISAELLYQESKKAKLGDLRKELENQLANIKKAYKTEEEFRKALKERGVTEKELQGDIRKGVYIKEFLDKSVYNNISITEEDKKAEYEKNKARFDIPKQIRASHILLRVKPDASDEEKKEVNRKIEELRKRAVSGEDFARLAMENSQDGSARRGGDLGYFKKGDMVKEFEDAAFGLGKDEMSKVTKTEFGYHIIKVVDKKEAQVMSYDEVQKTIERYLLDKRRKEVLDAFVAELKSKAKIEVY